MAKFLIAASFTVDAVDEASARIILQDSLCIGLDNAGNVEDFSVDDVLETWDELSQEVIDKFIPQDKEPVQLSFDFEKDGN